MMNKSYFLIVLFVTSCVFPTKNQKFTIVTGISPICSLIGFIGGDKVEVHSIIPNTVDPHTFSLKPSDAILIAKSDIVISLDMHIDGILLSKKSTKKGYLLNDHVGLNHNPHIWLSFVHPSELAFKIADILTIYFPNSKDLFRENAELFSEKLKELYIMQYRKCNQNLDSYAVIQQHPAWDYVLSELKIRQIGVLESYEGEQPSLKKIAQLIDLVKKEERVFLIGDTFSASSVVLQKISQETDAEVFLFNPMIAADSSSSDILDILKSYSELFIVK